MTGELSSIDTSPIEALLRIREKRDRIRQLVDRAEASRAGVAEAVYSRVVADYEARLAGLESEARPLQQTAREQQARLAPIHARLAREAEAARLDKEELEFRHAIGEIDDADFAGRLGAAQEALGARERALAEADELAARLADVAGPAEGGAPPVPPTEPVPRPPSADDAEATLAMPSSDLARLDTAEVELAGAARLVSADGDPPEEHRLGRRTTIGRTPDNDIQVSDGLVSRHHARITVAGASWVLEDLKSGNGTFVNDQRIEKGVLSDGDRLQIGPRVFVFRA
ncbi:MAG: FHA domain-containing protein [Vicinamibacteria bacterium]